MNSSRPNSIRNVLLDAAAIAALAAVLGLCAAALGQDTCWIDPATGQQVCPLQTSPQTMQMPSLYGIQFIPIEQQQPWAEPRCVKLRNTVDGVRYCFLTGNVVSIGGDSSYILSCAHGLGEAGDPVLVISSDGTSLDIAKVVAVDRAEDLGLLKLLGGPRQAYFELGDTEPPVGTRVFGGGFVEAGPWGGAWSTIDYFEGNFPDGRPMSCAVFRRGIFQGWSGGPVVMENSRLVGILHSTDPQEAFAVRLSRIHGFLERLGIARPAPPTVQERPPSNLDWEPAPPAIAEETPQTPIEPPPSIVEAPPAFVPTEDLTLDAPLDQSLVISKKVEHVDPPAISSTGEFIENVAGVPWWKLLVGGALAMTGVSLPVIGWAGARQASRWIAARLAKRAARRAAEKLRERVAGATSEAADSAATFPESSDRVGLHSPIERDLDEGLQLLQLARLEGSDALQDSIAGRLIRNRLTEITDSVAPGNEEKKQLARDLLHEIDQRFNEVAPTKFDLAQGT